MSQLLFGLRTNKRVVLCVDGTEMLQDYRRINQRERFSHVTIVADSHQAINSPSTPETFVSRS